MESIRKMSGFIQLSCPVYSRLAVGQMASGQSPQRALNPTSRLGLKRPRKRHGSSQKLLSYLRDVLQALDLTAQIQPQKLAVAPKCLLIYIYIHIYTIYIYIYIYIYCAVYKHIHII